MTQEITEYRLNIELNLDMPTELEEKEKALKLLTFLKPTVEQVEKICGKKSEGHGTDGKTLDIGWYSSDVDTLTNFRNESIQKLLLHGFSVRGSVINPVLARKYSRSDRTGALRKIQ